MREFARCCMRILTDHLFVDKDHLHFEVILGGVLRINLRESSLSKALIGMIFIETNYY